MLRKIKQIRKESARSLLVLSPEGKPLKSIRFNIIIFFLLITAAACGIAALFIPSGALRVRDEDGFKKLHLFEQNRLLRERIDAISQVKENCKDQITMLDRKKERVTALMGSGKKVNEAARRKPGRSYVARLQNDQDRLLGDITRWEAVFTKFMSGMETGNVFDTLPVCGPVETNAALTRPFGKVFDPFTGHMKWHYGVDYAAPVGTRVVATASGQVVRVENSTEWGKRVFIRHARGISTKYAHLGTVKVRYRQKVDRGEVIGFVGSSGLATGPHVHYELWHDNRPVDPVRYYFPLASAGRGER